MMNAMTRDRSARSAHGFRYEDGALPNLVAVLYATLGWAGGIWLLGSPHMLAAFAGVLLVAHSLVVGAYIVHELMHHTVFAATVANDRLGAALCWLSGANIADYAVLKEKHLRHHADRLDVVSFDYRASLAASPGWFHRAVLALEWAYVPAVEFLMRALLIRHRWRSGGRERREVAFAVAVRLAFWALLAAWSAQALALYAAASLLFLHVLRFEDAFQHTFDVYVMDGLAPPPRALVRDRAYEHANTYSDVISVGHPALNLFVLNFAYHNAHHARPAEPWYRLRRLHNRLYEEGDPQVLPLRVLAASYHRNRVKRVLAPDYGAVGPAEAPAALRAKDFVGAVGVSFLTAG